MLRSRVLDGPDCFEVLEGPWRELANEAESATPFQTWEWQSIWFRHLAGSRRPYVWTCAEGSDLVGLMPLVRTGGPWRTLRPMGCGPSDYLHPIARRGREADVADAFVRHIREEANADLVDLHQVRESEPLASAWRASAEGSEEFEQATCLVLDLPGNYDAYLGGLSKSLRFDARRLEKSPELRIELANAATAADSIVRFFDLHARRWRRRGLPGAFLGRKMRRFHLNWAEVGARNGWLHLGTLWQADEVAGVIYAMRFGKACYFYQSGFDPEKKSISPGTLLVADAVRRSIEDGLAAFDFLRGDEPYKRRWKPQRAIRNLRFLLPLRGAAGRLAGAWNQAGLRLETRVRARLEGRGLR